MKSNLRLKEILSVLRVIISSSAKRETLRGTSCIYHVLAMSLLVRTSRFWRIVAYGKAT